MQDQKIVREPCALPSTADHVFSQMHNGDYRGSECLARMVSAKSEEVSE